MEEFVNHPDHYNLFGKQECIESMLQSYGPRVVVLFCLTNAYKYLYRAGYKEGNSASQDLDKARWYLNFVEDRIHGDVRGKNIVKLYEDVKRELKSYDKS